MSDKKIRAIVLTVIGMMIMWQSYQVYQIERRLDFAEKNGLLKCKKPTY